MRPRGRRWPRLCGCRAGSGAAALVGAVSGGRPPTWSAPWPPRRPRRPTKACGSRPDSMPKGSCATPSSSSCGCRRRSTPAASTSLPSSRRRRCCRAPGGDRAARRGRQPDRRRHARRGTARHRERCARARGERTLPRQPAGDRRRRGRALRRSVEPGQAGRRLVGLGTRRNPAACLTRTTPRRSAAPTAPGSTVAPASAPNLPADPAAAYVPRRFRHRWPPWPRVPGRRPTCIRSGGCARRGRRVRYDDDRIGPGRTALCRSTPRGATGTQHRPARPRPRVRAGRAEPFARRSSSGRAIGCASMPAARCAWASTGRPPGPLFPPPLAARWPPTASCSGSTVTRRPPTSACGFGPRRARCSTRCAVVRKGWRGTCASTATC